MLFVYQAALQGRRRAAGLGRLRGLGSYGDDNSGLDFLNSQADPSSSDPILANLGTTTGTPIAQSMITNSPGSASQTNSGSSSIWDVAGQVIGVAGKAILGTTNAPAPAAAVAQATILGIPQGTFFIGAALVAVGAFALMKKRTA